MVVTGGGGSGGGDAWVVWTWLVGGGGCGSCGPTVVECGCVCVHVSGGCVRVLSVLSVVSVSVPICTESVLFSFSHALEARAHTP
jgi:hypothetical protein